MGTPQRRRKIVGHATLVALFVMTGIVGPGSPTGADNGPDSTEVYNGVVVDRPWAVAFVWGDPPKPITERVICSGVLINPRYVLTAQHCVDTNRSLHIQRGHKAVIGRSHLPSSSGEVIRVDKIFRMPGFRYAGNHVIHSDLALIRLERSSTRSPLPLASADLASQWAPGVDARGYGWGKTSTNPSVASADLRNAVLRINTLTPAGFPAGQGMTATWTGRQLCSGDSGGPFVKKTSRGERLIGITSDVSSGSSSSICDGRRGNHFIRVGNRGSVANSPGWYWVTRCMIDNNTCNRYPS